MRLSRLGFFDAIHWADFNAESAQSAAPRIDGINLSIRDHGQFWTDQTAAVTGHTDR